MDQPNLCTCFVFGAPFTHIHLLQSYNSGRFRMTLNHMVAGRVAGSASSAQQCTASSEATTDDCSLQPPVAPPVSTSDERLIHRIGLATQGARFLAQRTGVRAGTGVRETAAPELAGAAQCLLDPSAVVAKDHAGEGQAVRLDPEQVSIEPKHN
jgi:hypothetical protein